MLSQNVNGFFPYTPSTNLLYGLKESLQMLREEGLENVFARHKRHSEATRRAARAWGLEIVALDPAEFSASLTALYTPAGHSADEFRQVVLDHFNMPLGTGLGAAARQSIPHRPPWRLQRSDADRHAERRRDGTVARRRSPSEGRSSHRAWSYLTETARQTYPAAQVTS